MAIFASSLASLLVGGIIVYFTSPTLANVLLDTSTIPSLSLVTWHSLFVDLIFVILLAFFILCFVEPKWIAINQSFPYTWHLERNVGPAAFEFQLVVFETWHQSWLNAYPHIVCLLLENFFWLWIINSTFGITGLILVNVLAFIQCLSYKDVGVTLSVFTFNTAYSILGLWASSRFEPLYSLDVAKIGLFWAVVIRTASHIADPLPPTYHPETNLFDKTWGEAAYYLIVKEPIRAAWLFSLGVVSEFGSGIPGRLFGTAVYKVIYALGYRSATLVSVDEAQTTAARIVNEGWANSPLERYFNMESAVDAKIADMIDCKASTGAMAQDNENFVVILKKPQPKPQIPEGDEHTPLIQT